MKVELTEEEQVGILEVLQQHQDATRRVLHRKLEDVDCEACAHETRGAYLEEILRLQHLIDVLTAPERIPE